MISHPLRSLREDGSGASPCCGEEGRAQSNRDSADRAGPPYQLLEAAASEFPMISVFGRGIDWPAGLPLWRDKPARGAEQTAPRPARGAEGEGRAARFFRNPAPL